MLALASGDLTEEQFAAWLRIKSELTGPAWIVTDPKPA
jgi:hypothetical protein